MLKSITWRALGIALLAFITFMVTQSLVYMTSITVLHHLAFIFIYYFHERVWENYAPLGVTQLQRLNDLFLKAFTYEIVLGFLVLGVITWVITGSPTLVSIITVLYLSIRFIGYPIHDRIWSWFYAKNR